jgi:hypothetical protein
MGGKNGLKETTGGDGGRGHKKPGAPDSSSMIQDTKRYLQDLDRLKKTTSEQELFDQMTELYPHGVAN